MDPAITKILSELKAPVQTKMPRELIGLADPSQGGEGQLAQKFDALMQTDQAEKGQMVSLDEVNKGPSVINGIMEEQDKMLQTSITNVNELRSDIAQGKLSMPEMVSEGMKVSTQVATTAMNLQAKMGMATGARHAMDTLVKNQ